MNGDQLSKFERDFQNFMKNEKIILSLRGEISSEIKVGISRLLIIIDIEDMDDVIS